MPTVRNAEGISASAIDSIIVKLLSKRASNSFLLSALILFRLRVEDKMPLIDK